jgi:cell division FtsZ-interacting protein ZapD
MFENYLLKPAAITHVMNSIQGFRETPVAEAEIREKIKEKVQDNKFFAPLTAQSDWINKINAGKLLAALFEEISEQRVEYRKTDHSVKLSKWLLENHPDDLKEVANVLTAALKKGA